jgi:hypothetical protein
MVEIKVEKVAQHELTVAELKLPNHPSASDARLEEEGHLSSDNQSKNAIEQVKQKERLRSLVESSMSKEFKAKPFEERIATYEEIAKVGLDFGILLSSNGIKSTLAANNCFANKINPADFSAAADAHRTAITAAQHIVAAGRTAGDAAVTKQGEELKGKAAASAGIAASLIARAHVQEIMCDPSIPGELRRQMIETPGDTKVLDQLEKEKKLAPAEIDRLRKIRSGYAELSELTRHLVP